MTLLFPKKYCERMVDFNQPINLYQAIFIYLFIFYYYYFFFFWGGGVNIFIPFTCATGHYNQKKCTLNYYSIFLLKVFCI